MEAIAHAPGCTQHHKPRQRCDGPQHVEVAVEATAPVFARESIDARTTYVPYSKARIAVALLAELNQFVLFVIALGLTMIFWSDDNAWPIGRAVPVVLCIVLVTGFGATGLGWLVLKHRAIGALLFAMRMLLTLPFLIVMYEVTEVNGESGSPSIANLGVFFALAGFLVLGPVVSAAVLALVARRGVRKTMALPNGD